MGLLNRLRRRTSPPGEEIPLAFSWVLTNQLALGPMPASPAHWQQLEQAGLRQRFSCCYPEEEKLSPPPPHWGNAGLALPDHRQQEPLLPERLLAALAAAEAPLRAGVPLYLHCWAGRERSPLLAVGITARLRGLDLFSALDWVRRCHPPALPIYGHLEILDQLLKSSA